MPHLTLAQQAALITLAVGESFQPDHRITLEPNAGHHGCQGEGEKWYPEWKGTVLGLLPVRDTPENCYKFTAKVEPYGNPPAYTIYIHDLIRGQIRYDSHSLLPFQDNTPWVEALPIYKDLLSAESTIRNTFYKLRVAILRGTAPTDIPWKTLADLNLDDAIHACANQEKTNLSEAEKIVNIYLEPPKPPTHDELLGQYARYVESHAHDGGIWTPWPFEQWAEHTLASRQGTV